MLDLAGDRLALMDETGLDVQILSLTTPPCMTSGGKASIRHAAPTMLCGRVGDRNLDHPELRPVFESAATFGVPILLQPEA